MIIDSQVHAFDANQPDMPWTVASPWLLPVGGEGMVAAMAAVGVSGAIMVSPYAVYRFDRRYAHHLARTDPEHFGIVVPVDPQSPDVHEAIAEWKKVEGAVGVRMMFCDPLGVDDPQDPNVNAALATAARHDLPVNLLCTGNLSAARELAARHPDTRLVIDHLGLDTPIEREPRNAFVDLPGVLALAEFDNVAIKVSGTCILSHEAFPFKDIWAPVLRVVEAFGVDRCMWGTDWTRTASGVTYGQYVESFRMMTGFSESDLAMLMGGAVTRVYRWAPVVKPPPWERLLGKGQAGRFSSLQPGSAPANS
jgi:predicted TIM-barrel fold metal-dependent hydrolase